MRSAVNKMSQILQYSSDNASNITLLSETWQTDSIPGKFDTFSASMKEIAAAENFPINCFTCPRQNGKRGGGVATLVDTRLNVKQYSIQKNYLTIESVFVIVQHDKFHFLLGSIYRVPTNVSFQDFIDEFTDLLTFLAYDHRPVILAGDFNIKMNLPHDSDTSSFSTLISEFDFSPILPDGPSHRQGNVLDFAIVSSPLLSSVLSITLDSSITISDHYPVTLSLSADSLPSSVLPSLSRNRRFFNTLDHSAFSSSLSDSLSSLASDPPSNLQDYLTTFNSAITVSLDRFAPFQKTTSSSNVKPPWMDQEYINARRLRRRYQKKGNKPAYNYQKKVCARLVKEKMMSYYSTLFPTLCTNQQQLFKTFNKLFDRNKGNLSLPSCKNASDLANNFNSFFLTKVSDIRSNLPSSILPNPASTTPPSTTSKTFQLSSFEPTSIDELRQIIKTHGVKTSSNDPLPAFLLEENLELLLPHFETLVNLSITNSNFDGLKEAHVVPILKSLQLDKEDFKSYRPVSLLSFVSKLTERVVHNRVTDYLSSNDLHVPSQYGYKRHHSCETFLLKLIDDILIKVDRKLGVVVLIIDLSAAFDTVDHSVLLNILQNKFNIVKTDSY